MTATEIIQQIKALPSEEKALIVEYLHELEAPASAVMQAQHIFFYNQGDLFDMAAAYAYHLAENQPFIDGNKRAAAGSAIAFLRVNEVRTDFDPMKPEGVPQSRNSPRSVVTAFPDIWTRLF